MLALYCDGVLSVSVEGYPLCSGNWTQSEVSLLPDITLEQANSLVSASVPVFVLAFVFSLLISFVLNRR